LGYQSPDAAGDDNAGLSIARRRMTQLGLAELFWLYRIWLAPDQQQQRGLHDETSCSFKPFGEYMRRYGGDCHTERTCS
jgi:hypothetical protein